MRSYPRIHIDKRGLSKLIRLPRRIETSRLSIRPYRRRDLPALPGLIGDWEVARWLARSPHPYTAQDARDWLRLSRRIRLMRKGLPYVIERRDDGTLLGGIGISFSDCEIGYWLGRDHWGQGYATEAVQAATAYGFEERGLRRLWAAVMPGNTASCRVLEKVGFHRRGTRRYRMRDGEQEALHYRLSRAEWTGAHG